MTACAAAVLGLVSPGRHVAILEPAPPQVVDVVRRVGGMARTVSMRPTEWEFDPAAFARRVGPQTDLIIVSDPNPYSGQ
jgi:aspartate/methionine/tyrosine aminotransferase